MPTWKNNYWNNSPKHYHILLAFFYRCQFLEWFNIVPSQFFPPHFQNSQKTSSTNKHGLSLKVAEVLWRCNISALGKHSQITYQKQNHRRYVIRQAIPLLERTSPLSISSCSNFPQNLQYFFLFEDLDNKQLGNPELPFLEKQVELFRQATKNRFYFQQWQFLTA